MAREKRTILRTVRVNPNIDKWIKKIAESENRTVSNTIYNLLCQAIEQYAIAEKNRKKYSLADLYYLQDSGYGAENEDNEDNEDNDNSD